MADETGIKVDVGRYETLMDRPRTRPRRAGTQSARPARGSHSAAPRRQLEQQRIAKTDETTSSAPRPSSPASSIWNGNHIRRHTKASTGKLKPVGIISTVKTAAEMGGQEDRPGTWSSSAAREGGGAACLPVTESSMVEHVRY